jgi:opacity protein-like surface antigen
MNTRSLFGMLAAGTGIFLLICCTEAVARTDIGFKGIGPRIGYVSPEGDLDGTIEFGVAFEFGEWVRQLHWDGSVCFWSTGRDYQYYSGNHYDKYSWTLRDIVLRSGVNYHFLEGPWVPYAGGGLGLHFYSWDYSGAPTYNNTSDTEFGFYIDGGIEHKFSENWTGQLQLQFDFADPDQTALLFNLIYRLR